MKNSRKIQIGLQFCWRRATVLMQILIPVSRFYNFHFVKIDQFSNLANLRFFVVIFTGYEIGDCVQIFGEDVETVRLINLDRPVKTKENIYKKPKDLGFELMDFVDFTVPKGSFCAISGYGDAGKSFQNFEIFNFLKFFKILGRPKF